MDRRQALAILGGGFTAISGCMGLDSLRSGPGDDTEGEAEDMESEEEPEDAPVEKSVDVPQFSRFESYTAGKARLRVTRDNIRRTSDSGFRIAVFTRRYPRGEVLQTGISDPISSFEEEVEAEAGDETEKNTQNGTGTAQSRMVTVDLRGELPADQEPLHHVAERHPEATTSDPDSGVGRLIAETDRFRLEDPGAIIHDAHPLQKRKVSQPTYQREPREGEYKITIRDPDTEWRVALRVFKSEYIIGQTGWHEHNYPPYIQQANETGVAGRTAAAIDRVLGRTDRDPVPFAIEVVQTLPYVPESVAEGADEYIKYPAETLVDGGGDCEDSSILLASVLQAQPFDRECALIHPPDHMGVGIASQDYGGTFYSYQGSRYFYVETTHRGWSIGELPEEYADTEALVFEV